MSRYPEATVFVVDDDEAVRDSLAMLLRSVGFAAETYPDGQSFLDQLDPDRVGCIVLDVRMPGISGLELARILRQKRVELPVLFITGHGDVPMAVEAMQAGAVDFLQKPFRDQDLLDRIGLALEQNHNTRKMQRKLRVTAERLASLTPREHDVLQHIIEGLSNKAAAAQLGLSTRTVEIHRARAMQKMQASSLAALIQMVLEYRASPQSDSSPGSGLLDPR